MMRARTVIAAAVAVSAVAWTVSTLDAQSDLPGEPFTMQCSRSADDDVLCVGKLPPVPTTTTTTEVPTSTSTPPTSSTSTVPASTTTTSQPSTTSTVAPTTTAPTTVPATNPTSTSTLPATTTTAPPAGAGDFVEDFSTPQSVDRFQFETATGTERGAVPGVSDDFLGDHDMACGAPTTSRQVHGNNPAEQVWYCAPGGPATGHLMTGAASVGYTSVDFAPNRSFNNVQQICWDQNLTAMGGRKWTQVTVIPEADYLRNGGRLVYVASDQLPDPAHGFFSIGSGGLTAIVHGGMTLQTTDGPAGPVTTQPTPHWHDFDTWQGAVTEDKATRYRHCITETPQGVRVDRDTPTGHRSGIPGGGAVHIPQGQVRVIFQDDTYDNYKGDLGDRTGGSDPRVTWHWDSISIDVA